MAVIVKFGDAPKSVEEDELLEEVADPEEEARKRRAQHNAQISRKYKLKKEEKPDGDPR